MNSGNAKAYEVFISYSHKDRMIVTPIVDLLRSAGSELFRDEQNIKPGTRWQTVISAAIEDCRLMWVFWCSHSQKSSEVQEEYLRAVALEKEVVPVLLDSTPLPKPLSDFQWIDMRPALNHDAIFRRVDHVPGNQVDSTVAGYELDMACIVEKIPNDDGTWRLFYLFEPSRTEIERVGTRLQSWLAEHLAEEA